MTAPTEAPEALQVLIPFDEVKQLRSVLPWLVQALEERPNLTAKQRQRRLRTRTVLSSLLGRIGENPNAEAADAAPEASA
jgi:hypothetical protein